MAGGDAFSNGASNDLNMAQERRREQLDSIKNRGNNAILGAFKQMFNPAEDKAHK